MPFIPPLRGKSCSIIVSEDTEDGGSPLKTKLTIQELTGHLYGQVSLRGCPNISGYFSVVSHCSLRPQEGCCPAGSMQHTDTGIKVFSQAHSLGSAAELKPANTSEPCNWNWPKWKWEISRTECPQLDCLLLPGTFLSSSLTLFINPKKLLLAVQWWYYWWILYNNLCHALQRQSQYPRALCASHITWWARSRYKSLGLF